MGILWGDTMTLNKKAIIYTLSPAPVGISDTVTNKKEIWCRVEDVGVNAKYAALAAGVDIIKKIIVRKADYKIDHTNVTVDGNDYVIDSATYAGNDLFIALQLKRG